MQEIRWKEPQIISEIEIQRLAKERPQRMKQELIRFLISGFLLTVPFAVVHFLAPSSSIQSFADWVLFLGFLLFCNSADFFTAWNGKSQVADSCHVTKLGVSRLNSGEHFAWRDIADYRFETDERVPNIRVLIVEARGRKAPLRLYYEGDEREARLRDAMAQGTASTRKITAQGKQLTT